MPLQTSGPISPLDIQNEFGGSNPIGIDEYYGVASGIPTSGQISIGDFYGASSGGPRIKTDWNASFSSIDGDYSDAGCYVDFNADGSITYSEASDFTGDLPNRWLEAGGSSPSSGVTFNFSGTYFSGGASDGYFRVYRDTALLYARNDSSSNQSISGNFDNGGGRMRFEIRDSDSTSNADFSLTITLNGLSHTYEINLTADG